MKRKILLILVPLIVLGIALTGSHILVERLFILIAIVLLVSFLFALLGTRGLKGRLNVSNQHNQAGQPFHIEVDVENVSLWPKPFLRLKISAGKKPSQRNILVSLPSKGDYSWLNDLSFPRRGRYILGPLIGESTDMFGLFRLQRTLDSKKDILIYPSTVELPFFMVSQSVESSFLRNAWFSDESSGAISGVREYVPGDSLNRIHWKSTAHTGKLIVKEFDIDRSEKIWIILDLNKEMNYGLGTETTEEYSIIIAASIAKKYADSGRYVGMIANGDNYHYYPALQGTLNMWRIMEALAVVNADGQVPLQRIITGARAQMTGNSTAIIITASAHGEVVDSILSLKKQGIRVVMILLDASTFGDHSTSPEIEKRFQSARVPLYTIKKGDNLSEALRGQDSNISSTYKTEEYHIAR